MKSIKVEYYARQLASDLVLSAVQIEWSQEWNALETQFVPAHISELANSTNQFGRLSIGFVWFVSILLVCLCVVCCVLVWS